MKWVKNLYLCPTENCEVSATTKRNIKRHLKNCKKIMHNNKCKYCHKTFLTKSNRDRHVKQFHKNNNTKCEDIIDLNLNDGEINRAPTVQCIDRCNV